MAAQDIQLRRAFVLKELCIIGVCVDDMLAAACPA